MKRLAMCVAVAMLGCGGSDHENCAAHSACEATTATEVRCWWADGFSPIAPALASGTQCPVIAGAEARIENPLCAANGQVSSARYDCR